MYRISKIKVKNNRLQLLIRIVILFIIICLFIFLLLSIFNRSEASPSKVLKVKTYYVSKGDTLWSIANNEKNINSYYKNIDVQDIVEEIRNYNNIDEDLININQKLFIVYE